jgi:Copper type II ascorbate-dependent monooxygenase, C-terminal domain/Copper type II ascorbate-dependent monooxygenase, N-terminal domain
MKATVCLEGSMITAFVTTALALAGCSGDAPGSDPTGTSPGTGGDMALTYYKDAKPVIDAKCATCHTSSGIAPFPLTTFAEVNAQQAAIAAAVRAGTMPPWMPAKTCGTYQGDRSLTDAQKATITGWVSGGAKEGNPADAPAEGNREVGLSRVDLTLSLPTTYTPKRSPDEYRCFIVDWPQTDTTYVTGFGVKPGVASIVHHVIAYLATPDTLAQYQALDNADPASGYECFGGPGGSEAPGGWVGAWAPGVTGSDTPPGTGIEIPKGSKIVVQMHYNTATAKAVPDRTEILLKLDPTVEKKAAVMPWANPAWVTKKTMNIPAHASDAKASWAFDPSPYLGSITNGVLNSNQPFTMYAAGLHMHTRGVTAKTAIERKDGSSDCLLDIPAWNFHWQGAYGFAQPKQVNPGDKLSLECHWNNPSDVALNWGEGTGDEMCLATYYVTQ